MDRRIFLTAAAVALWPPVGGRAQTTTHVYRIGWLVPGPETTPQIARLQNSFRDGMREHGHVEGRDYVIAFRWGRGRPDTLQDLATELARLPVDVIVAVTSSTAHAARSATTTVPILLITPDPLSTGLVTNLARPTGNITGITMIAGPEIVGKYLQLVIDVVPAAKRIAILWNQTSPWQQQMIPEARTAARVLGLELHLEPFRDASDFDANFTAVQAAGSHAIITLPDAVTFVHRKRLAELALRHRLPALLTHLEGAGDGALIAFATDLDGLFRRAASYVDRLMKGATVGDLPVERPTTFRLAINLTTARQLGITVPPAVLARADEVIE